MPFLVVGPISLTYWLPVNIQKNSNPSLLPQTKKKKKHKDIQNEQELGKLVTHLSIFVTIWIYFGIDFKKLDHLDFFCISDEILIQI